MLVYRLATGGVHEKDIVRIITWSLHAWCSERHCWDCKPFRCWPIRQQALDLLCGDMSLKRITSYHPGMAGAKFIRYAAALTIVGRVVNIDHARC